MKVAIDDALQAAPQGAQDLPQRPSFGGSSRGSQPGAKSWRISAIGSPDGTSVTRIRSIHASTPSPGHADPAAAAVPAKWSPSAHTSDGLRLGTAARNLSGQRATSASPAKAVPEAAQVPASAPAGADADAQASAPSGATHTLPGTPPLHPAAHAVQMQHAEAAQHSLKRPVHTMPGLHRSAAGALAARSAGNNALGGVASEPSLARPPIPRLPLGGPHTAAPAQFQGQLSPPPLPAGGAAAPPSPPPSSLHLAAAQMTPGHAASSPSPAAHSPAAATVLPPFLRHPPRWTPNSTPNTSPQSVVLAPPLKPPSVPKSELPHNVLSPRARASPRHAAPLFAAHDGQQQHAPNSVSAAAQQVQHTVAHASAPVGAKLAPPPPGAETQAARGDNDQNAGVQNAGLQNAWAALQAAGQEAQALPRSAAPHASSKLDHEHVQQARAHHAECAPAAVNGAALHSSRDRECSANGAASAHVPPSALPVPALGRTASRDERSAAAVSDASSQGSCKPALSAIPNGRASSTPPAPGMGSDARNRGSTNIGQLHASALLDTV